MPTNNRISVQLDTKTAVFFSHMVRDGLAELKVDSNLPDDVITASIDEGAKGHHKLVVSVQKRALYCFVSTE
ncbi:MAG: hypothetical protein AAFR61_04380 [Bacteroidota bacterium]